jgi:hypothetical protein
MTLTQWVEARYGHLPENVRRRVLAAYVASQDRSAEAFLKDRGVDVRSEVTSQNYRDHLWTDKPEEP